MGDGTLAAVGKLGAAMDDTTPAFDIQNAADDTNMTGRVADDTIYTVDLETGTATGVGMLEGIEGDLIDIMALPTI